MRRLKFSFLALALATAAFAQSEAQIESDSVKRVGTHIGCQCGACQEDVNCNMSSGQCHFCKPARTKIYEMQKAGVGDDGIIDQFKKLYGAGIYRADPNSFFWLVPYLILLAGAFVLYFVVRRLRGPVHKPALAGHPAADDDPVFARYRDRIEKDTDKLD